MLNIVSAAGSSVLPYSGPGFSAIAPVTAAEVLKPLHSAPPKSSRMDTVSTSLLLAVLETFFEIIAYLANLSFSEGRFHAKFKLASVTPLLKSDQLDKTTPADFQQANFKSKFHFKNSRTLIPPALSAAHIGFPKLLQAPVCLQAGPLYENRCTSLT